MNSRTISAPSAMKCSPAWVHAMPGSTGAARPRPPPILAWLRRASGHFYFRASNFATLFMKIATFNINNINRRLPNLLRWLREAKPDVICLQELKSSDAEFPASAIDKAGYGAVWRGQRTWNGVAILARNADPVLIKTELPGDPEDREARYIEAAVKGVIVTSLYLPNGN